MAAAHLFSQCNVAWRSFPWVGVQGAELLILIGALFPPSVAPASQHGFRITELMLFCSTPWSPSWISCTPPFNIKEDLNKYMENLRKKKQTEILEIKKVLLVKQKTEWKTTPTD
jgi:hypothetical protein